MAALHEIVVHPEVQHQGLGALLIQYARDWFERLQVPHLELWVGVHNREAQQFYQKFGFQVAGPRRGIWQKMVLTRSSQCGSTQQNKVNQ